MSVGPRRWGRRMPAGDTTEQAARPVPSSESARLEMFSDGVMAIAITLLVLEISIPETESGGLLDALADQWPSYVAFVLSFVVIGIMWVSHHSMFERIAYVDRTLLFLNLLLLMGIAFLPFPTALLAEYVQDSGSSSHIAAAVYSATMAVVGLFFWSMWRHLLHHPELLVAGLPPERVRAAMRRSLVGPVVYAASIGLAFISAIACFAVYAGIAAYFVAGPSAKVATPDEPVPDASERDVGPSPGPELGPERGRNSGPESEEP